VKPEELAIHIFQCVAYIPDCRHNHSNPGPHS